MFPKEHGAYGQLLFPIVTALAVGRPGAPAFALSAAALCAFLAHEPLLVLLGQRGGHTAREQRSAALVWFASLALVGVALAIYAIPAMRGSAQRAVVFSGALAVILALVIFSKRERTTGGEILSAVTLSSLALAVGLASGVSHDTAMTCAVVYAASMSVGIVGVRAVIMHTRRPPALASRIGAVVGSIAVPVVLGVCAKIGAVNPIAPWASVPLSLAGVGLATWPPPARRLRVVGWTLVVATALTALVLVATLG